MERALVLGGSGFLGSHIADELTQRGFSVRVFDIRPSQHLSPGQEQVLGDIRDAEDVKSAAQDCNVIYNIAGLADIPESASRPRETVELNILGTVNALDAARAVGARRLVLASSIYVYAESGSFYRASKQSAERYVETYHDEFGIDFTILRFGSLYGRRTDERNAIHRMIKEALRTGCVRFAGPKDAVREYIHVQDAARLSVDILDKEFANRHLILTGNQTIPVAQVMQMLSEILSLQSEPTFEEHGASRYSVTPYSYNPRIGRRLVPREYTDLGQGLLDCIDEIANELQFGGEIEAKSPQSVAPSV